MKDFKTYLCWLEAYSFANYNQILGDNAKMRVSWKRPGAPVGWISDKKFYTPQKFFIDVFHLGPEEGGAIIWIIL